MISAMEIEIKAIIILQQYTPQFGLFSSNQHHIPITIDRISIPIPFHG